MTLRVLTPGLQTTLQDIGRSGFRHLGVGHAGALDADAQAIANWLVGNPRDAAVLEITLAGPRLHANVDVRIALSGASIDADCDGQPLPGDRPIDIPAGSALRLGACRNGARAWMAVAGGFDVPTVLGSASTDLRGGFGGLQGRALRKDDVLSIKGADVRCTTLRIAPWWIDPGLIAGRETNPHADAILRIITGSDATAPADALCNVRWQVGNDSNRQGLRLRGDPLQVTDRRQRISEPVAPGTVQLPPDGQPIVLLADAQTHGGYPRIGHVIHADWPALAQLRPGDGVRFLACSSTDARALWRASRGRLARIALAIDKKLG